MNKKSKHVRCICGIIWAWTLDDNEVVCDCGATLYKKERKAVIPDGYDLESMPYKEPGFFDLDWDTNELEEFKNE